jgi:hypothetical protein
MRSLLLVVLLLWTWTGWTGAVWGQRFTPPPFRPPVFRPAPVPHFLPHPVGHRQAGQSDDQTWLWILGVGAVILVVIVIVVWNRNRTKRIRIVSTPPGEAPEAVRGAWVGLELPLAAGETGPRPLQQIEVVSLQTTGLGMGYLVDGRAAVALLAAQHPEAAAWWHENCAAALAARAHMAFPPEVCERV